MLPRMGLSWICPDFETPAGQVIMVLWMDVCFAKLWPVRGLLM
jgi:hypothetical protein